MLATEREIFHRILTHFHPNDYEEYYKYFEEPERLSLAKIKLQPHPLKLSLDDPKIIFEKIHYSWYIDPLKKLPQNIIEDCLSLFTPLQLKGLLKMAPFKHPSKKKPAFLSKFYRMHLLKELGYDIIPPYSILPYTESERFLKITKKELVGLILHLGILELAHLSKKILDQKVLSKIEKMLTQSQRKVYKLAKKSIEPQPVSVRDFMQSIENKQSFTSFIEKRGIDRFARAIVLDHPYFIWHIAHLLDKGRGQELLGKSRRFLPNPYTPFFNKQLLEISQVLIGE